MELSYPCPVFDAAVALERILESNCQPRMMTALLWLTAGLSYRQACSRAHLAVTRAPDLQRTAHRLGLRELHLRRKAERTEILEAAWIDDMRTRLAELRAQAEPPRRTLRSPQRSPLYRAGSSMHPPKQSRR